MSRVGTKEDLFREIAWKYVRGREPDIDELRELYESQGFWSDEELACATREYKNAQLRRFARKPFYDEEGNRREIFSIRRENAAPDEKQQVFVFSDEATKEDFQWYVEDTFRRGRDFFKKGHKLLDDYEGRFGRKARTRLQGRLHLEFGEN